MEASIYQRNVFFPRKFLDWFTSTDLSFDGKLRRKSVREKKIKNPVTNKISLPLSLQTLQKEIFFEIYLKFFLLQLEKKCSTSFHQKSFGIRTFGQRDTCAKTYFYYIILFRHGPAVAMGCGANDHFLLQVFIDDSSQY